MSWKRPAWVVAQHTLQVQKLKTTIKANLATHKAANQPPPFTTTYEPR